jgi:hypothetical protein
VVAVRIPSKNTDSVWSSVEPILNHPRVLNEWTTTDEIYDRLVNAKADLWVYGDPIVASLVACIKRKADGSRVYAVELMACPDGADMSWESMIKSIEDHAKAIGCRTISVQGRKGWQRALQSYKLKQIILEKEL